METNSFSLSESPGKSDESAGLKVSVFLFSSDMQL